MSNASRERWYAENRPKPWERQEAEPDDAWTAFRMYRDQMTGPGATRSYARLGVRLETALAWMNKYQWKERCLAWDRHVDEIRQEEKTALLAQDAREVTASHMAMVATGKSLVSRELAKLDALSAKAGEAPGPFTLHALTRLAEVTVKLDRLVRGESTEKIEVDLSKLTDEELSAYEKILEKVTKRE